MNKKDLYEKLENKCLEIYRRVRDCTAVGVRTNVILDVHTDAVNVEEFIGNSYRPLTDGELFITSFEKDYDNDGLDINDIISLVSESVGNDVSNIVVEYADEHAISQHEACEKLYPDDFKEACEILNQEDEENILENVIRPAIDDVLEQREAKLVE